MNWTAEFSWVPSYVGKRMPSEWERRERMVDEWLAEKIAQTVQVMRLCASMSPEDINHLPLDFWRNL